jgi:putative peptidoglycan lipid II flippase
MMRSNPVHRYLPAIGLVSAFYGVNILLGLGRDSLLAAKFGATEQLDALLLGLNFVRTLGISLALAVAGVLVPFFTPIIMANDSRLVLNLSYRWLCASMIALIPLSLLLAYFASPLAKLLGPGLNDAGLQELSRVLVILSPLLIILACAGLGKALSESYGTYFAYPLFLGFCTMGLIAGVLLASPWGVQSAALGMLGGGVAGLAVQTLLIGRRSPLINAYPTQNPGPPATIAPPPRLPIRNVLFLLGSSVLVLLQGLVERAYASQLPPGSVVALSLSLNVLGVPSTLVLPAVSAVLLPVLSRLEQQGRSKRFGLPGKYYWIILLLAGAATLGLIFSSDVIVRLLFLRGKFTEEAAALTSMIIKLVAVSLIAYVLITVLRQVLIARHMMAHDAFISGITLLSKICMLQILVPRYGILGLAMALIITTFGTMAIYAGIISYSYRQRASFK